MIGVGEVPYERDPEVRYTYRVLYSNDAFWEVDREYRFLLLAKLRVDKWARKGYYARVQKMEVTGD